MNWAVRTHQMFYDNLISSGTKIISPVPFCFLMFYDNLISSGTKIINYVYKYNE